MSMKDGKKRQYVYIHSCVEPVLYCSSTGIIQQLSCTDLESKSKDSIEFRLS